MAEDHTLDEVREQGRSKLSRGRRTSTALSHIPQRGPRSKMDYEQYEGMRPRGFRFARRPSGREVKSPPFQEVFRICKTRCRGERRPKVLETAQEASL